MRKVIGWTIFWGGIAAMALSLSCMVKDVAFAGELPTVGGVPNPVGVCGSNLHCQWRAERFAALVLMDLAIEEESTPLFQAGQAHYLRAIDLCLASGACSQNMADSMVACVRDEKGCDE